MKNALPVFVALVCFLITSCHRPVAYFQRTPHVSARVPLTDQKPVSQLIESPEQDSADSFVPMPDIVPLPDQQAVASTSNQPVVANPIASRIERRMQRAASLLAAPAAQTDARAQAEPEGPGPKPKKKMRLGNRVRDALGIPLRQELNWWQRISWKLKASVIVILVAVLFAILNVTILAIIFGILGAFLLITGLKRSFKVRRPWF